MIEKYAIKRLKQIEKMVLKDQKYTDKLMKRSRKVNKFAGSLEKKKELEIILEMICSSSRLLESFRGEIDQFGINVKKLRKKKNKEEIN